LNTEEAEKGAARAMEFPDVWELRNARRLIETNDNPLEE
jgi:hypothetical protein